MVVVRKIRKLLCGSGRIRPRLSVRRRSPRTGHRLAVSRGRSTTLRRSHPPRSPRRRRTRFMRKREDSNPRYPYGYTAFRVRPIQPLWHASNALMSLQKSVCETAFCHLQYRTPSQLSHHPISYLVPFFHKQTKYENQKMGKYALFWFVSCTAFCAITLSHLRYLNSLNLPRR